MYMDNIKLIVIKKKERKTSQNQTLLQKFLQRNKIWADTRNLSENEREEIRQMEPNTINLMTIYNKTAI